MRFIKYIKCVVIVFLLFFIVFILSTKLFPSKTRVYGFSNLLKVEDIEELTVSEFKWVGITDINKKYLNYEADVRTYIDIDNIDDIFEVDNDSEAIIVKPKKIKIDVLDADIISTIPDNINIELGDQVRACMEDAKTEINKSSKLISLAEENEKQILESLIEPFARDWGYSIEWEEGELSGK